VHRGIDESLETTGVPGTEAWSGLSARCGCLADFGAGGRRARHDLQHRVAHASHAWPQDGSDRALVAPSHASLDEIGQQIAPRWSVTGPALPLRAGGGRHSSTRQRGQEGRHQMASRAASRGVAIGIAAIFRVPGRTGGLHRGIGPAGVAGQLHNRPPCHRAPARPSHPRHAGTQQSGTGWDGCAWQRCASAWPGPLPRWVWRTFKFDLRL
jgi:hypothetical protein